MKHLPPLPRTPLRRRMIWWIELIQTVILLAALVGVYWLAGGDGSDLARPIREQIEQPARPTVAVIVAALVLAAVYHTTDYSARRTERRALREWWELQRSIRAKVIAGKAREAGGIQGQRGEWVEGGTDFDTLAHPDAFPPPETGRPTNSRGLVEEIVRLYGPISFDQIHERLAAGGTWGPPLPVSKAALGKLLVSPGGRPVVWLAPRAPHQLYDHIDNVKIRQSS